VSELAADDRVVLCDAVRLELWNGARSARDHRVLRAMEEDLETVPTTAEVWTVARRLARSSRRRGLTIPAMDLLIAACAAHHRCELVHHDARFAALDELGDEEA
jgi:predicted nucleic acid-binding protein